MKRIIALLLALLLLLLSSCALPILPGNAQDSGPSADESTLVLLPDEEEPAAQPEIEPIKPQAPPEEENTEPEAAVDEPAEEEPAADEPVQQEPVEDDEPALLPEDGSYTTKEDVALYIHQYGHLPGNFITKKEAEKLGWSGGSLEPYAPGKCIGGSYFGNYEGLLPEKKGRSYTECDIDTLGKKSRGAKRIVFSNDGLIYYTEDHYESFELLYGEEDG